MGIRHFDNDNVPKLDEVIKDILKFFEGLGYELKEIYIVGSNAKEMRSEYYSGILNYVEDAQELIREVGKRESDLDILIKTDKPIGNVDIDGFFNDKSDATEEDYLDEDFKRTQIDIWYNQRLDGISGWVRVYPTFKMSD